MLVGLLLIMAGCKDKAQTDDTAVEAAWTPDVRRRLPAGDHYEETNSLGSQTVPLLEEQASALVSWADENLR